MNTIVQEDKIRFSSAVTLFSISSELMVFVLQSQPKTLRIKHLYDQSYSDLTTSYAHPIVSIHLSSSNHLVVVDDMNQVDTVYVQSTNQLKLTTIKGFQKKQLVNVVVDSNIVAMLTSGKIHILQLKQSSCVSNNKYDLGAVPIKGSLVQQNLYVCCRDNTIRKWSKSVSGKLQQSLEVINLKQEIVQIKAMRNNHKDYLVCLSKDKQVTVLSGQGKVVDVLLYEGEFKAMLMSHELLTIVSDLKESEVFSMYLCQRGYHPQSSRLLFNKFEAYNRNALYNAWQLLPISKKEWAAYSKRKGAKQLCPVTQLNEETFCLIYGKLQTDPSKLELLKTDTSKILNKDRGLQSVSRYKAESLRTTESSEQERQAPLKQTSPKEISTKQATREVSKQPTVKKVQLSDSFLKAIERIVEERNAPLISRINHIETKLNQIESKITQINSETELTKLYSATLEKEVVKLFEVRVVPKMEQYFQQMFADLANVFHQGIDYYSQKLMLETNLQKETFKHLLDLTNNAITGIVEATKSDLPYNLKIQNLLSECVKKKDDLLKKTKDLLEKVENGPFSYKPSLGDKEIKELKEEEKKQKQEDKKPKKTFHKSSLT